MPSLFEARTPPDDFCNCVLDVRATKPGLCVLAGTEASTSFLFLRPTPLLRAVVRGEPRDVRSRLPRCWFVLLAQGCPAAMPPRAPHLRGLRRGA